MQGCSRLFDPRRQRSPSILIFLSIVRSKENNGNTLQSSTLWQVRYVNPPAYSPVDPALFFPKSYFPVATEPNSLTDSRLTASRRSLHIDSVTCQLSQRFTINGLANPNVAFGYVAHFHIQVTTKTGKILLLRCNTLCYIATVVKQRFVSAARPSPALRVLSYP